MKKIWEYSPLGQAQKAGEAIYKWMDEAVWGSGGGEAVLKGKGDGGGGHARGGIATAASIFGEKGPEAAIPLDTGQRIPIAEVKGTMNQKELREIANLLKDINDRLETQNSTTAEVASGINKMTRVTKANGRSVF